MTYLVTGGAGFVGSHVAESLLKRGERVVAIDNFNDYYDPAVKEANAARLQHYDQFTLVRGDIRDAALLKELFREHAFSHIAHMAAMAGVRASATQVPLYMDVNVTGTMNLLENARDTKSAQFVFASTSSVYGKTEVLPFIETDTADRPLAAYPASKRAGELLGHTYHNLNQMNFTALRFFNVYGPAGRPDMMPMRLMHGAVDGTQMTLFNGGDIHRDWTYIDDIAEGVVAALDRPLGYEVINLGFGAPISLSDFVEIVEELSGREINKVSVPTPLTEPPITYCNNNKARELLGFNPRTPVQDGLRNTWEWFMKHYNLQG